ncbi:MAG TPA: GDP-mannose 4,6-dehydratase, partial [Flavobacteriales bacterium]|nr:GDP-mannose 4,6-dehydratase [Flavobacteriales bacterium]
WGHAKDYIEGMWLMLQQDKPDDYVLATGETHSVKEFIEKAFSQIEVELKWEGEGVNEKGIRTDTSEVVVEVDAKYFRPTEVELLVGDYSKAKKELGWEPTYKFEELVKEMVREDVKLFERDRYLQDGGHNTLNYHE